ncbi:sodium/hydrogen exchanger 9B2-like [Apostichopus japonicus]|uniref:sodium/hydrogen exchanger 9B2-like n=1 Tax=Stichopus japonicus TaxID=307972 RepID=UPI003AB39201
MSFFKNRGSLDLTAVSEQNRVNEPPPLSWEDPPEEPTEFSRLSENDTPKQEYSDLQDDNQEMNSEEEGVSWAKLKFTVDDEGSVTMVDGDLYPPSQASSVSEVRCCSDWRRTCSLGFRPWRTKYNSLPDDATLCQRIKYGTMCPPHGPLAVIFTWACLIFLLWAVLFSVLDDLALPGGHIFALYILVVASMAAGILVQKLFRLPPLLGMLIMGFILYNVPHIDVAKDISPSWSSVLRSMSLVIILLKAGLGIDTVALRKLGFVCLRLSFLPCLAEACTIAVVAYFILQFPWDWAFMLGFIVTALSPAVVVPSLLDLQDEGRGVAKGIPTLGVAACSLDNVLAISAFGLVMGISFSSGNIYFNIFRGPIEVVMGLAYGFLVGVLLWYFPAETENNVGGKRTILLLSGGIFAIFGSNAANFPGAGALGCITLAVVASYKWKNAKVKVQQVISLLWVIFEPILYGLIGAAIHIDYLNGSTVGLGLVVIFIGVVVRIIVTIFVTSFSGLTTKERVFLAIAWLPKATVQAALGPVALDTVVREGLTELELYAVQLLTIAVLSILATAPIGAALISVGGKKLLEKSSTEQMELEEMSRDAESCTPSASEG